MLGNGEHRIIPDITLAHDMGSHQDGFYLSTGIQYWIGINSRFNLGGRASFYTSLTDSDPRGPHLGLTSKFGLTEDVLAVSISSYYYYTSEYHGGQFDVRLIWSKYFDNKKDLTITPLASLSVSGYVAFGMGINVSFGIPLGNGSIIIRPEIGILPLFTDDFIPVISFGMGLDIPSFIRN
jgi:hypothetical protein